MSPKSDTFDLRPSPGLDRSEARTAGAGRRSGLLTRDVKVSRVVTWTLSVLLSSAVLEARCETDGSLLCPVPPVEGWGEWDLFPSVRSDLLPPEPDAMRGFPDPKLSCTLLRSACVADLALNDEDIAATWVFLHSGGG